MGNKHKGNKKWVPLVSTFPGNGLCAAGGVTHYYDHQVGGCHDGQFGVWGDYNSTQNLVNCALGPGGSVNTNDILPCGPDPYKGIYGDSNNCLPAQVGSPCFNSYFSIHDLYPDLPIRIKETKEKIASIPKKIKTAKANSKILTGIYYNDLLTPQANKRCYLGKQNPWTIKDQHYKKELLYYINKKGLWEKNNSPASGKDGCGYFQECKDYIAPIGSPLNLGNNPPSKAKFIKCFHLIKKNNRALIDWRLALATEVRKVGPLIKKYKAQLKKQKKDLKEYNKMKTKYYKWLAAWKKGTGQNDVPGGVCVGPMDQSGFSFKALIKGSVQVLGGTG